MNNDIQIHIDPSEVEKKLHKLRNVRDGAPKAVMRAMNRTVMGMKTDAAKEVSAEYNIKQKDVKEKLEVEKASRSDLSIALRSRGRPMRLVKFNTKANKNPGKKGSPTVYAKVKKSASGGFTGGFMATMVSTNGITGAFKRTGRFAKVRKGKYKGQTKETIKQLYGPGVVQMLDNKATHKKIQTKAADRFNKELDHQIEYLLSQQKG